MSHLTVSKTEQKASGFRHLCVHLREPLPGQQEDFPFILINKHLVISHRLAFAVLLTSILVVPKQGPTSVPGGRSLQSNHCASRRKHVHVPDVMKAAAPMSSRPNIHITTLY